MSTLSTVKKLRSCGQGILPILSELRQVCLVVIGLTVKSCISFTVESVTFNTLRGLKKRGVKVELGFPDEMWDSPDAEVTRLKNRVRIEPGMLHIQ